MIHQSPYPDVPPLPVQNVHHSILDRPDQAVWPADFVLHIDEVTGFKRSFTEFKERVRDGATALGSPVDQGGLGLNYGDSDVVAIVGEPCMEYIALVHSLLAATVIFSPIAAYSTPFELKHGLSVTTATRVFVTPSCLPMVIGVVKELDIAKDSIYIFNGTSDGFTSWDALIERTKVRNIPRLQVRTVDKETVAYLVFSSGTSGLPKAIMISHFNIQFCFYQNLLLAKLAFEVMKRPPAQQPSVCLAYLPLNHSYGLFNFSFRMFLAPSTLIFIPRWDVNKVLDLIPKYRVTALPLLPSFILQLLDSAKFRQTDLSSIQTMFSGAAHLPKQTGEMFRSKVPLAFMSEGWGQSECTIAGMLHPPTGVLPGREPSPGSVGPLLPSLSARIVREDSSDAGVNEIGELWIKGANVALGYWKNEAATKSTFVNGWLHTGDLFKVDERGSFFFEDRVKDTLKISGAQVSPAEIEVVLLAHPDRLIKDASVAGVSGGRTSDELRPRAWVVLSGEGRRRGDLETIKALHLWARENLSRFKWLTGGIEIIDEIPRSEISKPLRRVLRERYEEHKKKGLIREDVAAKL